MNHCDLIIPNGADNQIAFDLIVEKIKSFVLEKKITKK